MSFDARSRERLEALGRQLPRKLPPPEPAPAAAPQSPSRSLHPVEREQDPASLFRALMDASADGSVPSHLMERLRKLETPISPEPAAPHDGAAAAGPSASAERRGPASRRRSQRTAPDPRSDQALYIAFRQLLDEDEDTDSN